MTELQQKYEEMHRAGEHSWFSQGIEERHTIFNAGFPWTGKNVLEIGCGTGDLASMIARAGTKEVVAIDYAGSAIEKARARYALPNLSFIETSWQRYRENGIVGFAPDVIVMQGVLEHFENWQNDLGGIVKAFNPGVIITSSPCFLNPRGFVWLTLALLLDVPMSLTDKHFIAPWEMAEWATINNFELVSLDCDRFWGFGPDLIKDFETRLPAALHDAGLPTKNVSKLLTYLETLIERTKDDSTYPGATMVYKLFRSQSYPFGL